MYVKVLYCIGLAAPVILLAKSGKNYTDFRGNTNIL